MYWYWKRIHPAGTQAQVQRSRTTWDFRPHLGARTRWSCVHAGSEIRSPGAHRWGTRLACDRKPYVVEVDNGARIPARTVVIATGAEYRKPPLENLSHLEGAGVYYGATFVEAQVCSGEEVIVVGGGNSAGQAAVFLAATTKRVQMLVRSAGLADTMSRYLTRRIEETPSIILRPHSEIIGLEGGDHLERVRWRNNETGHTEEHAIRHVFLMTGARPNTLWLDSCVVLDDKGFIKTGPLLSPEDLIAAKWSLPRRPYLLETSLPGVFAVGDVRGGSIKRLRPRWEKGRLQFHSFIKYFRSRNDETKRRTRSLWQIREIVTQPREQCCWHLTVPKVMPKVHRKRDAVRRREAPLCRLVHLRPNFPFPTLRCTPLLHAESQIHSVCA